MSTTSSETLSLDLRGDVAHLTAALMDIESVSGNETAIADAVEAALRALPHLIVLRDGDAIVARTSLGRAQRVVLAGHLDTVPLPTTPGSRGTVPSSWEGETLYGRGATDTKGGVAVQLALAAALTEPNADITYVFYDHEVQELVFGVGPGCSEPTAAGVAAIADRQVDRAKFALRAVQR